MEDDFIPIWGYHASERKAGIAGWRSLLRGLQMTEATLGQDLRVVHYYNGSGKGSTTVYTLRRGTAKRLGVPEFKWESM
jgi:hypothetical protein